MAFIVETGSGTPGANAYASVSFVANYLIERNREFENTWNGLPTPEKQASIIAATDYIEQRFGQRFKGSKALSLIGGRQASGLISFSALPANLETLTVGLKTYRLVSTLVGAQENDVLIGATIAETIANLVGAINLTGEGGVTHEEHTLVNYEAIAVDQSPDLAIAARTKGENGNLIVLSETIVNATSNVAGFLEDGLDEAEQPLSFPRVGLYTRDGRAVTGVPLKLKQATAEYAVRAVAAPLAPDPISDDRLAPVVRKLETVGPITEETEYAEGGVQTLIKPYPAADRLLEEYITAGGGVIRG